MEGQHDHIYIGNFRCVKAGSGSFGYHVYFTCMGEERYIGKRSQAILPDILGNDRNDYSDVLAMWRAKLPPPVYGRPTGHRGRMIPEMKRQSLTITLDPYVRNYIVSKRNCSAYIEKLVRAEMRKDKESKAGQPQ